MKIAQTILSTYMKDNMTSMTALQPMTKNGPD